MKILFCCPAAVLKNLGAPKIQIELAEAMRPLGWQCDLVGPEEIRSESGLSKEAPIHEALRVYIQKKASDYDVIEYDHGLLPYPRSDFPSGTLMVARVALLSFHFLRIPIPSLHPWKDQIFSWLGKAPHLDHSRNVEIARETLEQADLITVANPDDERVLIEEGIESKKITLQPYGLSSSRIDYLKKSEPSLPNNKEGVIAFIGSFDPRKGSVEFPELARLIFKKSSWKFRLIGTSGVLRSPDEVLARFDPEFRHRIEVIPQFDPEKLADLLVGVSLGVFPSYIESFGFGVIEMLGAGIPVIAYEAPGPSMILNSDFLVQRGDIHQMSEKLLRYQDQPDRWKKDSEWSRQRASEFDWQKIGVRTAEIYKKLSRKTHEKI